MYGHGSFRNAMWKGWLHEHARKAQDVQIARSVRTATVETLFQGAEGMDEMEEADLSELHDDYLDEVKLPEGDINGTNTITLRDLEEALTEIEAQLKLEWGKEVWDYFLLVPLKTHFPSLPPLIYRSFNYIKKVQNF